MKKGSNSLSARMGQRAVSPEGIVRECMLVLPDEQKKQLCHFLSTPEGKQAIADIRASFAEMEFGEFCNEDTAEIEIPRRISFDAERQYFMFMNVLGAFGFDESISPLPTIEEVEGSVTLDKLVQIDMLEQPAMLFIPPCSVRDKISAIQNRQHSTASNTPVAFHPFANSRKWATADSFWRVEVIDGVASMPLLGNDDTLSAVGDRLNALNSASLADLDAYLMLFMNAEVAGVPIDKDYGTLLPHKDSQNGARTYLATRLSGQFILKEISLPSCVHHGRFRRVVSLI